MSEKTGLEIAVIGMSARFPDAEGIRQFWENLTNGVESISFITGEELEELGVAPELADDPNYVRSKGSVLQEREYFDAPFFDYTPREAEIMDPQMRIFHECTWEALENAGYYPKTYDGLIGLYAGATCSSYWEVLTFLSGRTDELGTFLSGHLNNKDFLSTRIAYKLDIRGPALTLQTACSTSLVAIHLACQAILNGECHMALAGGVTVLAQEDSGYLFQEGMVLSRDGHCRAFDAGATGFVGGNGAGVVVLKALEDAIAHRDHIYAVIKGTAVNNDGIRKVGFTAPSTEGQAGVIRTALQVAQVEPESIGYIEAHGTGTELGDLVELEALKLAFNTDKKNFCAVGSVKTNIGHTDSAAGAAGFIKTALALNQKMIPPSLNFETPNPRFDFENSPFYVNTKLSRWENGKYPLRAGVSSFGIGGTNAHVILEEWPGNPSSKARAREYQLILLSAKTPTALERMTRNLADYSRKNPGINLADAAYTLQVGRGAFQYRRMLVCSTTAEAIEALSAPGTVKVKTGRVKAEETPVIFMFPGLGSQYVNMGLELYQKEPLFRREIDRCFEILDTLPNDDIKEILYPGEAAGEQKKQGRGVDSFDIAQLVTFIFGYALAKLLMKWGIKPNAMIGYSFGEYTAACISGVLALEDALKLVVLRGKLINKIPSGAMLSVPLARDQLKPFLSLHHELSLAIDNGASCIVAGPKDAVAVFEEEIKKNGCICMRLQASRAIHSTMMEPILKEFEAAVGQVVLNEPQIPYISNVTGDWLTNKDAASTGYWAVHLRETVRFADGIKKFAQLTNAVFIEIGPGRDLNALITRHLEDNPGHRAVNIVRHPTQKVSDLSFLLNRIGRAWLLGVEIDWQAFHANEERYRLPLPTYSFDRQCYKIEGDTVTLGVKRFTQLDQTRRKPDIADWFYIPSWKRLNLTSDKIGRMPNRACWLLFIDAVGLGAHLAKQLEKKGQEVITVQTGAAFLKKSEQQFSINPHSPNGNDYDTLFAQLKQRDIIPDRILHLWGITGSRNKGADIESAVQTQDPGFYSLIYIARAIDRQQVDKKMQIKVITDNMHEVIGSEECCPAKATVLGPVRVIPAEYPNISCRSIDIVLPDPDTTQEGNLIDRLCDEFCAETEEPVAALRGDYRWVRSFEPTRVTGKNNDRLKQEGVYLLIGGLGFIGFTLAKYLAKNVKAKLILTGRSAFPPKSQWDQYPGNSPGDRAIKQKIQKVQELEKLGADVLVFSADVSNQQQMEKVINVAEKRFGQINGVIHCAGELDTCLIRERTRENTDSILAAKVKGTLVLYKLLKDVKLDFIIFCSSLRSFLPAPGAVVQVATSNFFDYFANYYAPRVDFPFISIDWDGWQTESPTAEAGRSAAGSSGSISPEKGTEVFRRILEDRLSQVAVSASDLMFKIELTGRTEEEKTDEAEEPGETPAGKKSFQRPELDSEYVAPRNKTEKILANIWARFFGFENVGIRDDFFELGGDSLKAIMVLSNIHKELDVKIPMAEIFNIPTIEGLAEYAAGAAEEKFISIETVEKKEYYELSYIQKRLWLITQMAPETSSYHMPVFMEMNHQVDAAVIKKVFHKLVARHESLRTGFKLIGNEPVQFVKENVEIPLRALDISALEQGEKQQEQERIIKEEFEKPFNLSHAPLFRVCLIKMEPKRYTFVFSMHHIIGDGVSMDILKSDFHNLYEGLKAGNEVKPEPLPLTYKDFSEWFNRQISDSAASEKAYRYWHKKIENGIPVFELPKDFSGHKNNTKGANFSCCISQEIKDRLKTMSEDNSTTLFIVLFSTFNIFLSHLSGQEDIVCAIIGSGRNHISLQNIVGFFLNSILIKSHVEHEDSFRDLLEKMKGEVFEAFQYQNYPIEIVLDDLKMKYPNISVAVNMLNEQEGTREMELTSFEAYHTSEALDAKFDIELYITEYKNGILIDWLYKKSAFKADTIGFFANSYLKLLNAITGSEEVTS